MAFYYERAYSFLIRITLLNRELIVVLKPYSVSADFMRYGLRPKKKVVCFL